MLVFAACTAVDAAFGHMAVAVYFVLALSAAGLRAAVRGRLGISGGLVSDACACCLRRLEL